MNVERAGAVLRSGLGSRRVLAHLVVTLALWPAISILAAIVEAHRIPYYTPSWLQARDLAVVGAILLLPNFLIASLVITTAGAAIYGWSALGASAKRAAMRQLLAEPILLLLVIVTGTAVSYPAILGQGIFAPLAAVPVWLVLVALVALAAFGIVRLSAPGKSLQLGCVLSLIGLLVPLAPTVAATLLSPRGRPADIAFLGIDSLSQTDDVAQLQQWVRREQGSWYSHPVTPGLITNAVWTSILTAQPVHRHGIFHIFQEFPAGGAELLRDARNRGFRTISLFPDQLTCAVGSEAGFDDDRSGPIGWRQLALPLVENASVILPLLNPLLPRASWLAAPPNLSGTFTYDVSRDIREMLTAGRFGSPTAVFGHLTYLHVEAYPRTADLSLHEVMAILRSRAGAIRDRGMDWQDSDRAEDPVRLHAWKIANLQRVLVRTVAAVDYLKGGNRLLLFSDHGDRVGLRVDNFSQERYFKVVLATFNTPARPTEAPISLIDLGTLAGMSERPLRPAPSVEYTVSDSEMWPLLVNTARADWSGRVTLDLHLLSTVFGDLRAFQPWSQRPVERAPRD